MIKSNTGQIAALGTAAVLLAAVAFAPSSQAAASTIRINSGGATVKDGDGQTWLSDRYFLGGRSYQAPSNAVAGTLSDALYSTERYGMTGYDIPVSAPGTYDVEFKHSELWFKAPDRRVFDITIEGVQVVDDLDLFAADGYAAAHRSTHRVTVKDKVLSVRFTASANAASISGIAVHKVAQTTTTTTKPNGVLIGSDDFTGASIDASKWSIYSQQGGTPGLYTRSNVAVRNGELQISAGKTLTGGVCWCDPTIKAQTYGKWEVRARMEKGQGYGPALLLWPDKGAPKWPAGGEIDFAEMPKGDRSTLKTTVHYGADKEHHKMIGNSVTGDFTQWHVYGVEWREDRIDFYLDGKLTSSVTQASAIPKNPMHLGIQMDMGSKTFMGLPDSTTPDKVTLHVDWVKIYR